MELLEVMKKRFSVRKYKEQQIEPEKLTKVLEAAHVAPTATNAQPVRLIVVQSEEGRAKLDKAARLYGAPTVVIVCADHDRAWVRKYDNKQSTDIDASILTDHMMLEATEQGLGSLWVCWFDPKIVKEEFDLPDNLEPINLLALGYSDADEKSADRHGTERIDMEELVTYR